MVMAPSHDIIGDGGGHVLMGPQAATGTSLPVGKKNAPRVSVLKLGFDLAAERAAECLAEPLCPRARLAHYPRRSHPSG